MSEQLTIFFADIGGSTALYQKLGDTSAHKIVTDAMSVMTEQVAYHQGELLRTIGDEVLAVFPEPSDAFFCALSMQNSFESGDLSIRVGFHHGESIRDSGDVYGNAVNLAARLSSLAKTGEIVTSAQTVDRFGAGVLETASCVTEKLASITLKGMSEPIEVHRIEASDGTRTGILSQTTMMTTRAPMLLPTLHLEYAGESYRFVEGKLTVGRSPSCDIQVDVETSSRTHGYFEFKNNKFWFTDESSNGTWYVKSGEQPLKLIRETTIVSAAGGLGVGFNPSADVIDTADAGVVRFQVKAEIVERPD